MTLRRLPLLALVALLGTLAAPAAAQTHEDPEPEVSTPAPNPWDRVLAASVTLGLDTPFGIAGAALEVTPFRYLSIYAGGGVGREGGRFTAGLRPQFPIDHMAMGVMLGVAGGPFDWDSQGDMERVTRRHWEMALFFHAGLTFEHRWNDGFFGRLELGVESLLAPGEADACRFADGNDCGSITGSGGSYRPVRGWAGLTVGYAFAL